MEKKKKALYTKKSISYGLVNGISSLKTNMTGTYLSFFLTTFVGLTNVQLGTMNTVKGLIGLWGSFVIGVIMQKVRLPWGRYRSWIYIMMPLAGIFQILTFVNWGNLPEGIKFPLVFVICVLDTFLYNFAFAAYTGLMIPLAPDPTERTGLAGARSQINSIGKVFFGFVAVAAIAFIGKLFNIFGGQSTIMLLLICVLFITVVTQVVNGNVLTMGMTPIIVPIVCGMMEQGIKIDPTVTLTVISTCASVAFLFPSGSVAAAYILGREEIDKKFLFTKGVAVLAVYMLVQLAVAVLFNAIV